MSGQNLRLEILRRTRDAAARHRHLSNDAFPEFDADAVFKMVMWLQQEGCIVVTFTPMFQRQLPYFTIRRLTGHGQRELEDLLAGER